MAAATIAVLRIAALRRSLRAVGVLLASTGPFDAVALSMLASGRMEMARPTASVRMEMARPTALSIGAGAAGTRDLLRVVEWDFD